MCLRVLGRADLLPVPLLDRPARRAFRASSILRGLRDGRRRPPRKGGENAGGNDQGPCPPRPESPRRPEGRPGHGAPHGGRRQRPAHQKSHPPSRHQGEARRGSRRSGEGDPRLSPDRRPGLSPSDRPVRRTVPTSGGGLFPLAAPGAARPLPRGRPTGGAIGPENEPEKGNGKKHDRRTRGDRDG